jgi:hypothetical protein
MSGYVRMSRTQKVWQSAGRVRAYDKGDKFGENGTAKVFY